jgi:hypothetical protein
METSSDFLTLEQKAREPWIQKVYKVINRARPHPEKVVADAEETEAVHSMDDINEIKEIMYATTLEKRAEVGDSFQTLGDFTKHVHDGFWNPASGIGSRDDPGTRNYAYIPVSMSPQEATAYYASGGIPAIIIDKKAKGPLLNGYTFEGEGWTPDEFKEMHDYGEQRQFGVAIADSLRDGLIYGGAVAYPRLKQDTVHTLELSMSDLLKGGWITKDCIDYFVTTDRWNCVIVPNWNVTARDYLTPSHYYIPIGGVKVATERSAIVRPKMLPYWGMLPQIGWGVSDFEGYIPSVLSYQIMMAALTIIFQQMSLLFHQIPIDGLMAQNGMEAAKWLFEHNDEVMKAWSMVHPVTISSAGEVKVVERHFENVDALVKLVMVDIGARSGIPMSVIFADQPKGLADSNEADVLLKQAESVIKIGITVRPQYRNFCRMLAYSCFGPEYFATALGAKKLNSLALSFNPPSVQSNKEKAESGGKFADMMQKLVSSDIPVDVALKITLKFFEDIELPKDVMDRLTSIPESMSAPDYQSVLQTGGLVEKLIGQAPPGLASILNAGKIGEQVMKYIGSDSKN